METRSPRASRTTLNDNVSDQQGAPASRLAKTALICGILGFPLWLLSYSWVPFALIGHQAGELVDDLVAIGEVGGLLVGLVSIGSGFIARRRAPAGSRQRRWASWGLVLGAVVLALIVGLNLLGLIFHL